MLGDLGNTIFKLGLWPKRFFVKATEAGTVITEQSEVFSLEN